MADSRSPQEIGARIETLLGRLRAQAQPALLADAEELVELVVGLYGAGLERIVELLEVQPPGAETLTTLAADPLVGSLLVLHDLHPVGVDERIQRALDGVRPYLGSHAGGIEYLGVDDAGVAHLRLQGTCHGCPSSSVTVRMAVVRAIEDAAPELAGVDVEGLVDPGPAPQLLQVEPFGARNGGPVGRQSGPHADGWARLEGVTSPLPGETRTVDVGGAGVLMCAVGGELYAYRNGCTACGGALDAGRLDADVLTCPACGGRFDVRLAGRSVAGDGPSLEPLPLLPDRGGWKVALPGGVAS